MWAPRKLPTDRPPKPSVGVDGSLDTNLTCWYCKNTAYELDNCEQLQCKLTCKCAAMQGIVTEESVSERNWATNKNRIKSMQTQFKIMKWAIAKCPSVKLKIMGESVPSLLNSGSMVSLMWQDHFNTYFRPHLGPAEGSVADAYHMFDLTSER